MNPKKKQSEELNEQGVEKVNEKFSLIEKIIKLITRYGYKKVISALLIFMLFIGTVIIFSNQKIIVQRIIQEQKEAIQLNDARNLQFRVKEVNPRVDAILYKLMAQTNADRVFVLEMHNGTDNPSGLPFAFCDMTYEIISDDTTQSIISEYQSINLSSYKLPIYLIRNKKFFGDIEELKKIDRKIGSRIEYNGSVFVGMYGLTSSDIEIGVVGITYKNHAPENYRLVEGCLLDASQKLSILLDISKNIDTK